MSLNSGGYRVLRVEDLPSLQDNKRIFSLFLRDNNKTTESNVLSSSQLQVTCVVLAFPLRKILTKCDGPLQRWGLEMPETCLLVQSFPSSPRQSGTSFGGYRVMRREDPMSLRVC
jgi:hypothetical protein